jgi:hypothetical protein
METEMLRNIVAAASLAVLAACATATPYQPAGWDGSRYGYFETPIEADRYRVNFSGNSLTDRQTVENYLLYRAAELTLQNGYDYFIVADRDTEARRRYQSTGFSGPAFGGFYGYRSPWGFYPSYSFYNPAFGWYDPWGPSWGYRDFDYREVTRYTATAEIKMGRGQIPPDPNAFDARQVQANLRSVTLPPPVG